MKVLNEKMWEAFSTIESTLIHLLPAEYQMFMFGGKIKLRDIIVQIFLGGDAMKDAFVIG